MNGIGFKNMKVFKESQWFNFQPITLLTGTNNSGKSSVINALKLLQENIDTIGLDNLIKTRFTIKDPVKYGSIKSFINDSPKENNNHFGFRIRKGSLEYRLKLKVIEDLEDYAMVDVINIIDFETEESVFVLKVVERKFSPKYKININIGYFIKSIKSKINKTRTLHKRIDELRKLLKKVDSGKSSLQKAEEMAVDISDELGVNITLQNMIGFSINEIDKYKDEIESGLLKPNEYTDIIISRTPHKKTINKKYIEDIGVIFEKEGTYFNEKVASEKFIIKKYEKILKNNFINFNFIWKEIPNHRIEFEEKLLIYYEDCSLSQAYAKLNVDILIFISKQYWEIEFTDDHLIYYTTPPNHLVNTFIKNFNDFGFVSCLFTKQMPNSDEKYSPTINYSCNIKNELLYTEADLELNNLINKGFQNEILNDLAQIFLKIINKNEKNISTKSHIDGFSNLIENIIHQDVKSLIIETLDDLINKMNLKLNNTFVSSNRFSINKVNTFYDNSDFTKQLYEITNNVNKQKIYDFINKWLREFEIADEFLAVSDSEAGNFKAYLINNNKRSLLTNYGLGTNQLLPIIFSIAIHNVTMDLMMEEDYVNRTVVIEEPESNLHPALQSKLANLFVDAIKTFNLQIIIETHSEYLIRKLQYLIGSNKSEVRPEDAIIYYFYKPGHQVVAKDDIKQVEKIEIDEFGRLSKEFGSGFFDEADKIALDIFLLKHSQSN